MIQRINWQESLKWMAAIGGLAVLITPFIAYWLNRRSKETQVRLSTGNLPYQPTSLQHYDVACIKVTNSPRNPAKNCKGELVEIRPSPTYFRPPIRLYWAKGGDQQGALDLARGENAELCIAAIRIELSCFGHFYICDFRGPDTWGVELAFPTVTETEKAPEYVIRVRIFGDNFKPVELTWKLTAHSPIFGEHDQLLRVEPFSRSQWRRILH